MECVRLVGLRVLGPDVAWLLASVPRRPRNRPLERGGELPPACGTACWSAAGRGTESAASVWSYRCLSFVFSL